MQQLAKGSADTLSALGDAVSVAILKAASQGLQRSSSNVEKLQITPRKYYSRLRKLIELGCVEKQGSKYVTTMFGDFALSYLDRLDEIVQNKRKIQVISNIKKSGDLSAVELDSIKRAIDAPDLTSEAATPFTIITTYDQLVREVNSIIGRAQDTILMATKYSDYQVTVTVADRISKGVRGQFINAEENDVMKRLEKMKNIVKDEKIIEGFRTMIESPNFEVRYYNLPYGFLVVDGVFIGLEFVSPVAPDNLAFGLSLESRSLSELLTKNFQELWGLAKEKIAPISEKVSS